MKILVADDIVTARVLVEAVLRQTITGTTRKTMRIGIRSILDNRLIVEPEYI